MIKIVKKNNRVVSAFRDYHQSKEDKWKNQSKNIYYQNVSWE